MPQLTRKGQRDGEKNQSCLILPSFFVFFQIYFTWKERSSRIFYRNGPYFGYIEISTKGLWCDYLARFPCGLWCALSPDLTLVICTVHRIEQYLMHGSEKLSELFTVCMHKEEKIKMKKHWVSQGTKLSHVRASFPLR